MWCALFFPSLPLDVFERAWRADEETRPFVVASSGHNPHVTAANARAHEAGIRAGQSISGALALVPGLVLRERDIALESAALAQVATIALAFTPMVALAPPAAIVTDIGGSLRLFGGLAALVGRLRDGVQQHGFALRVGLAPTPAAALALARAGGKPVHEVGALPHALGPLALLHFDLDANVRTTLAAAGVATFGEACTLPRDGLARRFGPDTVATLDRALGRIADPRVPYVPPPQFEAKLELPTPVHDIGALAFAVNRLVQDLAGWLLARGLGVVRLSLTLLHERALMRGHDSPATATSFALGSPARAPVHLTGVLRERLARLVLPAPVEAIVLASEETAPLAGRTRGLLPGSEADAAVVPLGDRLRARLGDRAVRQVLPHAEHRPERALRDHAADRALHLRTPASPLPAAPRPVWLLAEPLPLGSVPEGRPWILRDGPERIESGWWDGEDVRRDYFVAETPEGDIVWIFRDHRYGTADGEWFVQGLFA
jgi:protein ImuB